MTNDINDINGVNDVNDINTNAIYCKNLFGTVFIFILTVLIVVIFLHSYLKFFK